MAPPGPEFTEPVGEDLSRGPPQNEQLQSGPCRDPLMTMYPSFGPKRLSFWSVFPWLGRRLSFFRDLFFLPVVFFFDMEHLRFGGYNNGAFCQWPSLARSGDAWDQSTDASLVLSLIVRLCVQLESGGCECVVE